MTFPTTRARRAKTKAAQREHLKLVQVYADAYSLKVPVVAVRNEGHKPA